MVQRLGIFESNQIISNEELFHIENFEKKYIPRLPLYIEELYNKEQLRQDYRNNNKFKNLMFLKENESSVYLV